MPPTVNPGIPPKRALTSKESALFKELLTLYETRQLKKGRKVSDQILDKFPEHGETMCMKGLILTHLGKRDEGIELVKKGLRFDLTSHICWHVFGLIQKAEKSYEEALKSYTQALRFDKENLNILRDAAQLQTHLRLYDGLVETRHTLLRLRPTLRQHWIALVVAYHLKGDLIEARKVIEHYHRILKNIPDHDIEYSETLLYQIRILEELEACSEALAILNENAHTKVIVDRTTILETRARLQSKLKHEDAQMSWRTLLDHNPDNHAYYRGYLACHGVELESLTEENQAKAVAQLRDIVTQLPKAAVPRWLLLTLSTGDEFRELAEPYIISALTKGIPSLFADVKSLYKDKKKLKTVQEIVENFKNKLVSETDNGPCPDSDPTIYLWTLYFLAQHYSYLTDHVLALKTLETAIEHTPTLPELYVFKARVLKRAGDLVGASKLLDQARLLDGQDRFLNTKSAKYRLRAGLIEEGNDVLGLFTKKDSASPGADLEDMQSMLYLLEDGNAHLRAGKLGFALKRFIAIQKIFDVFEDDQYDFHGYTLRKYTINIYQNLVSWENRLRQHPAYISAALAASQIYVSIYDDPSLVKSQAPTKMSGPEKKAKNKAKKLEHKAQDDLKKAMNPNINSAEDKGLEPTPGRDEDLDGYKLLSATDPLERAAKLLNPLASLVKDRVDVWAAIYDVAVRRRKYLQALGALQSARAVDPDHPEVHLRLIDFKKAISSLPLPLTGPIGTIVEESLRELSLNEVSLDTYNSQYLQRNSASAKAIFAVAQASLKLDVSKESIEETLFGTLEEGVDLDIKTAMSINTFLNSIKSSRAGEFRTACDNRFPLSTVFKPASAVEMAEKTVDILGDGDKPEEINS